MQKIYAHRGASGYAPENTLDAFSLAASQGAQGVELDVHLSRDGEIMVIHDETVDRVSNGTGCVVDMTCAELKRLRFDNGMPGFRTAQIPTLREVFEVLGPAGLEVNVEIKNNVLPYDGIERQCIELAAQMGMEKRVLYSSFNHYSLTTVKEIDAGLPCGLLYDATMIRPWAYAAALEMDALHPRLVQLLVPGFIRSAHKRGFLVNPWTVNEEAHLSMVLRAGADIVITNYPDRALSVLGRIHADQSPSEEGGVASGDR